LVFGLWSLVFGLWSLVLRAWSVQRSLVLCARTRDHGPGTDQGL